MALSVVVQKVVGRGQETMWIVVLGDLKTRQIETVVPCWSEKEANAVADEFLLRADVE